MQAETINCPMCGAATSTESPLCAFCGSRLATVACPNCFAMMFIGSKHCPRCGAAAVKEKIATIGDRKCPRCKADLQSIAIGESQMLECPQCLGLWLDSATFEKICADREQQAVVLGAASLAPSNHAALDAKVNYIPCPECQQLMNRANFARCSGVIIDLCKNHGIWFDRDELSRIIEFVQGGGMEVARSREKAALEEERRRLRQEQMSADLQRSEGLGLHDRDAGRITGIASAGDLLKLLLG
jgi:Zn-finger nucleic acid-binding protein